MLPSSGGLKHGTQRLDSERARSIIVLMVLSVAAMVVPSLAFYVHTPAEPHENTLSVLVSVVLLVIFVVTLPASLRRGSTPAEPTAEMHQEAPRWPVWLAVGLLALAAALAAFVSDWFVVALEPAMSALHISEAFAGLVVVAIAGNAIENVVGIQLAAAGRSEYAFSVVVNSPMQIALVLAPLPSSSPRSSGSPSLTLVFPPMLVVARGDHGPWSSSLRSSPSTKLWSTWSRRRHPHRPVYRHRRVLKLGGAGSGRGRVGPGRVGAGPRPCRATVSR